MPGLPFLGRLFFREYLALVGSFILIGLEIFVRLFTLALPERILRFLYERSRRVFKFWNPPESQKSKVRNRTVVNPIAQAADFVDICNHFGYYAEEHVVQTRDGYLLGVHRLAWRKGEENERVNSGPGSLQKKVVYLHHGLMMNSEVWVCLTEQERCLPFILVEKGFDVWLGNNRGNKYSKKSTRHSPTSNAFWDFSIDQFAFHDIPDTISYVLATTKQKSLAYIGFSQGTAQAFATLSIHPSLNEQVDVFIALAPAMSPPGLANGIVASLIKSSPEVLFLAFGRRSILSSATMWQQILYPPIFVRVIDMSLAFLFGWKTLNMSPSQKLAAYPHLFSFTSTKSVVHWFQIIRNGKFQMYDDEVQSPLGASSSAASRYYKVAKFPTRNIRTPVVLVYGGSDSLVDISIMLKELPAHTVAKEVPHYEHLDFLWGKDVDKVVFPHVFEALSRHVEIDGIEKPSFQVNGRHLLEDSSNNKQLSIETSGKSTLKQRQLTAAPTTYYDTDQKLVSNSSRRLERSEGSPAPPQSNRQPSISSTLDKSPARPTARPLCFSSPSYYDYERSVSPSQAPQPSSQIQRRPASPPPAFSSQKGVAGQRRHTAHIIPSNITHSTTTAHTLSSTITETPASTTSTTINLPSTTLPTTTLPTTTLPAITAAIEAVTPAAAPTSNESKPESPSNTQSELEQSTSGYFAYNRFDTLDFETPGANPTLTSVAATKPSFNPSSRPAGGRLRTGSGGGGSGLRSGANTNTNQAAALALITPRSAVGTVNSARASTAVSTSTSTSASNITSANTTPTPTPNSKPQRTSSRNSPRPSSPATLHPNTTTNTPLVRTISGRWDGTAAATPSTGRSNDSPASSPGGGSGTRSNAGGLDRTSSRGAKMAWRRSLEGLEFRE